MIEKLILKDYILGSIRTIIFLVLFDVVLSIAFSTLWINDEKFILKGVSLIVFCFFFTNVVILQLITDICIKQKKSLYNVNFKRSISNWKIDVIIITTTFLYFTLKLIILECILIEFNYILIKIILFDLINIIVIYKIIWNIAIKYKLNELALYSISILLSALVCSSYSGFTFSLKFELLKLLMLVASLLIVCIKCNKAKSSILILE